jgi:apolipoprotein N-acyltransferase
MKTGWRSGLFQRLVHIPAERSCWLWLVVGLLFLPFTFFQTVIPLAAWIAPIFLLRFARTCRRLGITLALIFLTYVAAFLVASRGMPFNVLGFLGATLFKPLVWTLPYAADRLLGRRLGGGARSLVFPCAFTTVDWVLSVLRVSSAGSPAYSQEGFLPLLQILSITGMWAITFLLMWCAALVNGLWEQRFEWRPLRRALILFVAVLVGALLFGAARLATAAPPSQSVMAATITIDSQTSKTASSSFGWLSFNRSTDAQRAALRSEFEATVEQMLERSETALRAGAKIIAWQESSGWVLEEDKQGVLDRACALAKRYGGYLQISLQVLTRTPSLPYIHNQSILIGPAGQVLWTYDKTHPVPFDEALATFAGPGKLPLVDTPYGRWSTAICYDTYYPGLLRQAGRNDTAVLFAPTNDPAPWAESTLAMADYRDIENGFVMIRPTGNGVSAVIDPQGRILDQNEYVASGGIMLASLPIVRTATVYSRIGNLLAYLCAAGLIFLIIAGFRTKKSGVS